MCFHYQEPALFSCSIRDNILYGALDPKSITEDQLIQAASEANALSFINDCPQVGNLHVLLVG